MADVKTHNRELARELGPNARRGYCWPNAVLALSSYRGDLPAFYVEGVLSQLDGLMEIDHGWLEIGDWIVDPTLHDCPAEDYYPVFRYTLEEVVKCCNRRRRLPYYVYKKDGRKIMALAQRDVFLRALPEEEKAKLIQSLEAQGVLDGD